LGKEGNRLLKIIEEPPENTLFLLVAENADLIINTILSRTQMLRIPRIEEEALIEVLQKRQYLPLESAQQIALLAEGNYNEALNLIANFNNDNQTMLVRWLTIILQRQLNHFNAQTERFTELGRESQKNFLRYSLHFLRQCMLLKAIPKHRLALTQPETELAQQITPTINIDKLEQIFKLLNDAYYHIERNANPRILFFNLTIKVGDVLLH
jgi:DNA polymerase-3 subunit delta'